MTILKAVYTVSAVCLACLFSACNGSNATKKEAIGNQTAGQPVETRKPDVGYIPAFAGQTRAPGIKTAAEYEVKIITENLDRPWGIIAMPNGDFLVNEKEGKMRVVTADGKIGDNISGIPAVDSKGQGGLLGITLDPDFATNRTVYWSFSEKQGEGNLTAVAKGVLSADNKKMESVQVIFRATPAYDGDKHFGSRLVFDKQGNLFVSTGERSDKETRKYSQDLNSGLGKVLRMTKNGEPVAGNPFMNQQNTMPQVYTYGHRNVQGMDIHPETGEIWITEMGPKGGDELNLIQAGKNYGWPEITYGVEYTGAKISNGQTKKEGMEQPVYFWDPVLSPSGMTFYRSNDIPEWKNNLFIGGLNSNHIARLVIKDNRVVGEERLLADQQQRFRAVTEGKDGALYAITDSGRLYRIGKKK